MKLSEQCSWFRQKQRLEGVVLRRVVCWFVRFLTNPATGTNQFGTFHLRATVDRLVAP